MTLSNSSLLVRLIKSLVVVFVLTVSSPVKVMLPVIVLSPPIATYPALDSTFVKMFVSIELFVYMLSSM